MNQNIHDLADAYAVGALTEAEYAEYTAHLEHCPSCRREVADLLDVTSAMSESVAVEPPPGLRASVLAAIAQTPQEPAASESEPQPEPLRAVPAPTGRKHDGVRSSEKEAASNVVPLRRSWATTVSSLVAAAAVLAAVAFGGLWWQERQDADAAVAQAEQLTTLLSAGDVQTVPGVSQKQGHTGAIVMSRSEGEAIFVASDLPDLPSDQVYEAWTIQGADDPQPAGTFSPDDSSSLLALPDSSFDATTMAITVEPEGGSEAPTSDAVVTFAMPAA
jgi:anti-sigma-K factor RskA